MSLRFIIGRAGGGKTFHCLEAVRAELRRAPAGPALLLLVPEQASYQTGRELLEGLPGFCRAQVVSFNRIADMVPAVGGALPALGESARLLVLRQILAERRSRLRAFAGSVERAGFVAALADALTELVEYRTEPARLSELADRLSAAGGPAAATADKLADLAGIAAAYDGFLAGRFVHPESAPARAVPAIAAWPAAAGAQLWIDGFAGFTPAEYAVLEALLPRVARAEIALCLDPNHPVVADPAAAVDTAALFSREAETYARLCRLCDRIRLPREPPLRLNASPAPRFAKCPALAHLERELPADEPTPWPADPAEITLTRAENRRAEVESAARDIRRLIRDQGFRARDVAVVVRNLAEYADRIEEVFPGFEIPYFIDRPRAVGRHPVLRAVRAALRTVCGGWETRDVLDFLAADLIDAPRESLDRFAEEIRRRLRSCEDWTRDLPWEPIDGFEIDAVRKAATGALRAFAAGVGAEREPTVRTIAAALWAMLEELHAAERLESWAKDAQAARPALADVHRRVLPRFGGLLDEIVEAVGDRRMSVAAFAEAVEPSLEAAALGQVPQSLDRVIIGQIERSRLPEVRAVFVLGLAEGVFPRRIAEDAVLSDADRERLASSGVESAPPAERRLFDETTLGYLAFTRASQRLRLSRPQRDDDGNLLNPSRLLDRLLRAFPKLETRAAAPAETLSAADDVDDLAALVVGRAASSAESGRLAAVCEAVLGLEHVGPALRRRLLRPLPGAPPPVPPGAAVRLTVRSVERFAECPFKHFAHDVLGVREPAGPELTVPALAGFQQAAMEGFLRRTLDDPAAEDWSSQETDDAIGRACGAADKRFGRSSLSGSDLLRLRRHRNRLQRSAEQLVTGLRASGLRPRFVDLEYGRDGGRLPGLAWTLRNGATVVIGGAIDRVDAAEAGGRTAVVVREYRRSDTAALADRLYHGLSLGPALNLLVLVEHGQALLGEAPIPAGLLVLALKPPAPGDAGNDPLAEAFGRHTGVIAVGHDRLFPHERAVRRNGLRRLTAAGLRAFLGHVRGKTAETLERLAAGETAPRPFRLTGKTACDFCTLRPVCRFDPDRRGHGGSDRYRSLSSVVWKELRAAWDGAPEESGDPA
jgi:ATP-dependent helicase/nuclease subunit B